MNTNNDAEKRTAVFSECRTYRYRLNIVWDESLALCQFVGLNPSTADEVKDDPTIRRCKQFCRDWGYGGLVMTNLFAFRHTDPKAMMREPSPVGPDNDLHLLSARNECGLTIAAWGKDGDCMGRWYPVAKMIAPAKCFGRCKNNQPKHPLYMPANTQLQDYTLT